MLVALLVLQVLELVCWLAYAGPDIERALQRRQTRLTTAPVRFEVPLELPGPCPTVSLRAAS